MLGIDTVERKILIVVEQIQIEEIQNQAHGYFGLLVIVNAVALLQIPFMVSALAHLSDGHGNQTTETNYMKGCSQILWIRKLRNQLQKHILRNLVFFASNMNGEEYSTSVINIYHEASSKIVLANEPQEHEHSSDVISVYK